MDQEKFDRLVNHRIEKIKKSLVEKGKEYGRGDDRLSNFKRAAEILRLTPLSALRGMWMKHVVSILDIFDDITKHGQYPLWDILDEKIKDNINYLILAYCLIVEEKNYIEGDNFITKDI